MRSVRFEEPTTVLMQVNKTLYIFFELYHISYKSVNHMFSDIAWNVIGDLLEYTS